MKLEQDLEFVAAVHRFNNTILALEEDFVPSKADQTRKAFENIIKLVARKDKEMAYYMAMSVWYGAKLSGIRRCLDVQERFLKIASKYGS